MIRKRRNRDLSPIALVITKVKKGAIDTMRVSPLQSLNLRLYL